MADKTVRYTAEFKRQMVALARSGRRPASLSREFGVSAMTIGSWIKQAARDTGQGDGGLSSAEREELQRLRLEKTRQVKSSWLIASAPSLAVLRCRMTVLRFCQKTAPILSISGNPNTSRSIKNI